jgi:alpha-L-fucosidase
MMTAMPLTAATGDERTQWYRNAKFGMFLHWGAYSVAGVEASWPIMVPNLAPQGGPIGEADYRALPKRFDPTKYDARAWVRTAKQAGMRYMVITTKHHDGFCMFDAPGTDYKITSRFGRDVVAELASACQAEGMKLGFYYSPPDMNHPGFRDTNKPATTNWEGEPARPEWKSYLEYMESHIRVLLTKYGEVAILWFDGLFGQEKYEPERFHRLIRQLSPKTLVNDRLGPDLGDYVTPEQFFPGGIPIKRTSPPPELGGKWLTQLADSLAQKKMPPADVMATIVDYQKKTYPTAVLPSPEQFQLWETCMTLNSTWGYCPSDKNFKSADKLISTLVEVASRGGNFLLNVGPTPEGTFPDEAQERLRSIGGWMSINGDAIRGTTYGPIQGQAAIRTTSRDGRIYVHVIDWPKGKLEIARFPSQALSATLLATKSEVRFEQEGSRLTLDVPATPPAPGIVVLEIRT